VGSPVIQGDPSALIKLVLRGRGTMPGMAAELSDEEIAALLSYIRAAWGNHSSAIDLASVKALR
jgi:mono/diheme cytochrome c family protein